MKTLISMAAVGLLLIFTGIVAIASSIETGASSDLAAHFARFLPGSPMPSGISCDGGFGGYYEEGQMICRTIGTHFCERGYLIISNSRIVHTAFLRCNFPLALLVAEYGRWEQKRGYGRVIMVRWPQLLAQVRRNGWFNLMEPVSMLSWRQPQDASPTPSPS
ncbi:MAG: hypothetical protein L0Z53_01840 [Acidobacteriales bacterium]|nr:hypothetical protein [Terriglobales bacterium]